MLKLVSKWLFMIGLGLGGGCLTHPPPLNAQTSGITPFTHPNLFVEVQDSVFVQRITGTGDTIPPQRIIAASYRYEMVYDSTSRISYTTSEFMRNGARLKLRAWMIRRLVTASLEKMTDSSRTENFPLVTGDNLSFYREFRWYNPKTKVQDTANYYSEDTLDYAVELVRASDGTRLALLDSFGVLSRTSPGVPVFYGTHPIFAKVTYEVPSSMNGVSAFVRVRLYARGEGAYQPIRLDDYTVGASEALSAGFWSAYLLKYGGGLGKLGTMSRSSSDSHLKSDGRLVVRKLSPTLINIDFEVPNTPGSSSIVIYDVMGSVVFCPYSSSGSVGLNSARHAFDAAGTYFVTLLHNGGVVQMEQVTISK